MLASIVALLFSASLTLRHSFVLFLACAIALPFLTKTHPTGTSAACNASSAWKEGRIAEHCNRGVGRWSFASYMSKS